MEPVGSMLIGRDAALAAVVDAIRNDRPVAVLGEAGIGKTSLVRAAAGMAGRALLEGGGFATLSWLPYLALRRATGLVETSDPGRVATLVERLVGPDLLFIDDLQWTDDETREVVGLLIGRVALVAAVRDGDAGTAKAVEPLVAGGAQLIRLQALNDEESGTLTKRLRPELSPARVARIVERAGGNPLLIEEMALQGESSTSLARAIVGQLELLADSERGTLELVALAGRPLPAGRLGPAAARLEALGFLRPAADGLEVRHGLIAEAIVEQLEPEQQLALQGRLAELIDDPAERARHLAAAGRRTEAFEVARAALAATTDPRTRAVLLLIAAETSDDDTTGYRIRAAMELGAVGRYPEAIATLETPLAGDDNLRALAAAALCSALGNQGRQAEAWAVIEGARALQSTPGSEGAIELAVTEATALVNLGRLADALELVERVCGTVGEAAVGYRLAGHRAALRLYAGQTDQLDALEASVDSSLAAGDGGTAAGRAMDLYYSTLAVRGGEAAKAVALESAERLEGLGYHTRAAELRADATQAAIYAGELGSAVVLVDSMLEEPLGPLSRQRLAYTRGLALALLGHVDEAERTLAEVEPQATDDFDGRGSVLWCWAEACLWAGQPARALEMARASLELVAFNEAEFVLPSLARAWAEVELGKPPTPGTIEVPFRFLAGAAPEYRGLEALARGDHVQAVAAFDEAADLWAGFHVPRELLCRWAAGNALQQAGRREDAVDRLRATEARADAIGFEPLAARTRRSLRLAGERAGRRRAPNPAGGLLTGREREVLVLVERGLTNAEIARRMSLGRPTIARLLSNSMLKLGAESRAHAVVLAARVNQVPGCAREGWKVAHSHDDLGAFATDPSS